MLRLSKKMYNPKIRQIKLFSDIKTPEHNKIGIENSDKLLKELVSDNKDIKKMLDDFIKNNNNNNIKITNIDNNIRSIYGIVCGYFVGSVIGYIVLNL